MTESNPHPLGSIAVTGASGVIGRRLVPALLAAGASVRVLVRQPVAIASSSVQSIPGDLRDARSLAAFVAGSDAVIHLAGIAHTALGSPAEEAAAAAINVGGTRSLLQAARAAGTPHFLYFSSAHVYAGQQGLDLHEHSSKDTGHGYAAMKLQAEDLLRQEAGPAQTVTILRPCLTYGPGVRFNLQQLLQAVQAGRYVHPGGADVLRSFASVDTVAAAAVHLVQREAAGNLRTINLQSRNIYNVADREPVSLRRWIDVLAAELAVRPPHTVPVELLRLLAAAGTVCRKAGLPAPLTTESLRKLTAPFTLNLDLLAATGFVWPSTTGAVIAEMVAQFQIDRATLLGRR